MNLFSGDSETKWYQNYSRLWNLAHWLDSIDMFDDTSDVILFFEKPWKYNDENTIYGFFERGIKCPDCNSDECGCFSEYDESQAYIDKLETIEEALISQIPTEESVGA